MKFSTKLGLWFFFCILIIETGSMLFLHQNVVQSLVDDEMKSLLARGDSHRDVLEESFTANTLQHIVLMESKTDTEVVITDQNGNVIAASIAIKPEIKPFIMPISNPDQIVSPLALTLNWYVDGEAQHENDSEIRNDGHGHGH